MTASIDEPGLETRIWATPSPGALTTKENSELAACAEQEVNRKINVAIVRKRIGKGFSIPKTNRN